MKKASRACASAFAIGSLEAASACASALSFASACFLTAAAASVSALVFAAASFFAAAAASCASFTLASASFLAVAAAASILSSSCASASLRFRSASSASDCSSWRLQDQGFARLFFRLLSLGHCKGNALEKGIACLCLGARMLFSSLCVCDCPGLGLCVLLDSGCSAAVCKERLGLCLGLLQKCCGCLLFLFCPQFFGCVSGRLLLSRLLFSKRYLVSLVRLLFQLGIFFSYQEKDVVSGSRRRSFSLRQLNRGCGKSSFQSPSVMTMTVRLKVLPLQLSAIRMVALSKTALVLFRAICLLLTLRFALLRLGQVNDPVCLQYRTVSL